MIKCKICDYLNHEDNFKCEGDDCGIPLDLDIEYKTYNGLPNIISNE